MPPTTSFTQAMLPDFKQIIPREIETKMHTLLDKERHEIDALLSSTTDYSWDNLMQPLEERLDELHNVWSPIAHLHSVKENEGLRDAYNKTLPLLTAFHTEMAQNENLFNAITYLANKKDFTSLNEAQRKIVENELRDFKLSGIHLPKEKKVRFAELQLALSQLMTRFSENILDATGAFVLPITDETKLKGLPQQALQLAFENARRRQLEGYAFTLDYPSYSTAIRFLENRELRKILYEAYVTRASDRGPNAGQFDNTAIMEDILKTRHEIAHLVGYKNYAEYSLATKMAKTPDEVWQFLNELVTKCKPVAQKEYLALKEFAAQLDGIPHLEAWDIAYYAEKLSETQYQFSQEALRPYFPINKVLTGLFALVNQLYGITIKEEKEIDVWEEEVRFFSIYDEKHHLRAGFYIDLYARPHKRDGAWMDDCRTRRKLPDRTIQYPVAFLTCNFMPPVADKPALLTHDDVLTLFHEFGHCLHHMLTQVDYAPVAGINGVPWDAVEFPSQFMENFCWEKNVLALIAEHYQTHEPLPEELYQKMIAAKHFHTGLAMIRQLEFSIFDFKLHCDYDPLTPKSTQSVLDEVRQLCAVIPAPSFNRFQHSFSHIFAGGYAAGYYSYKWAEVLSADAYGQFEENGIFDHKTGQQFLENILEVGGVQDPMAAFIAFRGRRPTIDALLRHNGLS